MPLQDIKIKKRLPNVIFGLIFGLLAMYFGISILGCIFYIMSVIAFTFTDQITRIFLMETGPAHFVVKGSDVKMEVRDKDGNIKSQSK